jgi:hypothetical protein
MLRKSSRDTRLGPEIETEGKGGNLAIAHCSPNNILIEPTIEKQQPTNDCQAQPLCGWITPSEERNA